MRLHTQIGLEVSLHIGTVTDLGEDSDQGTGFEELVDWWEELDAAKGISGSGRGSCTMNKSHSKLATYLPQSIILEWLIPRSGCKLFGIV